MTKEFSMGLKTLKGLAKQKLEKIVLSTWSGGFGVVHRHVAEREHTGDLDRLAAQRWSQEDKLCAKEIIIVVFPLNSSWNRQEQMESEIVKRFWGRCKGETGVSEQQFEEEPLQGKREGYVACTQACRALCPLLGLEFDSYKMKGKKKWINEIYFQIVFLLTCHRGLICVFLFMLITIVSCQEIFNPWVKDVFNRNVALHLYSIRMLRFRISSFSSLYSSSKDYGASSDVTQEVVYWISTWSALNGYWARFWARWSPSTPFPKYLF